MKMKPFDLRAQWAGLQEVYNLRDDHARGRLISLGSALMAAIYNVFITGIFYTGFLSMYDISITGVGVISFIPYIASCLSVFSPTVLERFKRRKPILVAAKILFYALYIIATTLMPQFVVDPQARLMWFIGILFVAYGEYALFSPGFTPWFYNFYPVDNHRRTRYIALNQIFASIMSSAVLLLSGLLTDAVAGSAHQNELILGFRYLAFVLVIFDVGMQACAKEYPYPEGPKLNIAQVFTLPFHYKKFLLCVLLMFYWNFLSGFNSGLWQYHLLNHMHFSYTLMNAMSVAYTVILVLTTPLWQRVLRRYSWIKTFGIANLIWVPTEVLFFLMTRQTSWIYIPNSLWQNAMSVGINLAYANILYLNLPKENSTAHIAFYTVGCNLFAFLGTTLGTAISGIGGDVPMLLMGLEIYSVQFTTLMRGAAQLALGLFCVFCWRKLTPDADIAEIEDIAAQSVLTAQRKRQQRSR